ncbi:hypothetical protein [Corynebacterium striatum]|uniref:hypothetical protein n=1 Tax=Corynebacterium striatum TaxID=43770 RepID=UPI0034D4256C
MSQFRVFKAYGAWHVYEYGRERYESFPTWAEAMHYADQQARTVEVTLPRNPLPLKIEGEEGDTDIVVEQKPKDNSVSIKDEDLYDEIVLRRLELKPLALALLAHTERIGE